MICKFKNIVIFVVLLTFISNDANTTKIQRGHTGESPEVIFRHRLDVGSSDPLLLFNQIIYVMLPTNDESGKTASLAISAEQIIYDLVTTDEASRMRQHLRDMLDAFLLSEDESRERKEVYGTYLALDRLIQRTALIGERRAG